MAPELDVSIHVVLNELSKMLFMVDGCPVLLALEIVLSRTSLYASYRRTSLNATPV